MLVTGYDQDRAKPATPLEVNGPSIPEYDAHIGPAGSIPNHSVANPSIRDFQWICAHVSDFVPPQTRLGRRTR
eukprot:scaffold1954_cov268-Pinguiococcus_pyrenoidosus.AAC.176